MAWWWDASSVRFFFFISTQMNHRADSGRREGCVTWMEIFDKQILIVFRVALQCERDKEWGLDETQSNRNIRLKSYWIEISILTELVTKNIVKTTDLYILKILSVMDKGSKRSRKGFVIERPSVRLLFYPLTASLFSLINPEVFQNYRLKSISTINDSYSN